ncbi:MAG: carbon monoxide dehydrogenase [Planctomycetes bacterium DG_23]|nr:MAG: carbon monoxide dehydrogenase [Planctomycetes bacterium DG_23]
MKVAISGKGGAGKTTIAAGLAKVLADAGKEVLAIDADPATNLAATLGYDAASDIKPVAEMRDLIRERTEAGPQGYGKLFKLNPRISDIPEKFLREANGVKFLVLGTIQQGGGGCYCPENHFLKLLLSDIMLSQRQVVIVDLEAGLEHLGRATVEATDALLVVVEPGSRSLAVARRIAELAPEIGLKKVFFIGNKIATSEHKRFLEEAAGERLLGVISYDERIAAADFSGRPPFVDNPEFLGEMRNISRGLERALAKK